MRPFQKRLDDSAHGRELCEVTLERLRWDRKLERLQCQRRGPLAGVYRNGAQRVFPSPEKLSFSLMTARRTPGLRRRSSRSASITSGSVFTSSTPIGTSTPASRKTLRLPDFVPKVLEYSNADHQRNARTPQAALERRWTPVGDLHLEGSTIAVRIRSISRGRSIIFFREWTRRRIMRAEHRQPLFCARLTGMPIKSVR